MFKVFGNAVGHTSFEIGPDKFIGVELRRISGEVKGLDSRIASKELLDEFSSMNRASVPEEEDPASEMPGKVPEKMPDLSGPNVFVGVEACVETKAFSLGRDRDGGDSRYLGPPSCDLKRRSSALERPGSLKVWDKRESALIQEDQVGSEPIGLFLYAAKPDASNSESPLPAFPWLFEWEPDNSSPDCPSDTKDLRGNSVSETSCGPSGRYVSKSKRPSSNRLPRVLLPGCAPKLSSAHSTEAEAGPDGAWALNPPGLFCGRLAANVPRSLSTRPLLWPRSGKCVPASKAGPPVDGVFPVFGVCHEVSSYPPRLPLEYRLNLVSIEC